jgi:predicted dehydrogenase
MVSVGIIGCGTIASEHAGCLHAMEGVTVRGYADLEEERARAFMHKFGGSYHTHDPRKVLADDAIDAVYICTHVDSHMDLGIAAARAGKHVMMEKPLALTLEKCDRILEEVEKSNVRFMTGFKLRFYPTVHRVRDFLPSPTLMVAQMMDTRWPDDFWGNDPIRGGGNVLSQGCHTVDLVCHLMGSEPVSVRASGGNMSHPGLGIVDTLAGTLHFPGGRLASIVQADSGTAPLVSKFSFQLFDGTRTAHLHRRLRSVVLSDGEQSVDFHDEEEQGLRAENEEFIDAIRSQREPSCGVREGRRAMLILLRAFQSMREGTPVDLVERQFL